MARSSATVVCQPTAMPISARRRLSHWLLVSRFWPLVSSLPMERISHFMAGRRSALVGRMVIIMERYGQQRTEAVMQRVLVIGHDQPEADALRSRIEAPVVC